MEPTSLYKTPVEYRDADGIRETRSYALQVKASDDGTIEGYGSVFGVLDKYDDIIANGAFAESLSAHKSAGTMPAMLWQHDATEPIGVWDEMSEDGSGLRVKGRLALDTDSGRKAHSLLKMKAINGLSVGFISKQWAYNPETNVRTLKEIDLWEVSLVTFPANAKARVTTIKSAELETPKDAERALREAGFSKSCATAFVSRVMRMGEARRESANSTAVAIDAASRLLKSLTSN